MFQPVQIHPENPKLFEFRGKPLVLITATEHYGAVMNRPFRFDRYLTDTAERGLTLTRLFTLFRELQSAANPYSTCKPESPDYIAPFERVGPGTALDYAAQVRPAASESGVLRPSAPVPVHGVGQRHHRRSCALQQHLCSGSLGTEPPQCGQQRQ